MNEEQKLELIQQFTDVTGNAEQARSFLESSNWNLETAVNGFFQGGINNVENDNNLPQIKQPKVEVNDVKTPNNTPIKEQRKIHGFGDYKVEEKKDPKSQEYYTGGKNSGIAVMTPGEEDIMKKASNSGAKVEIHDKQQIPKFAGSGFKLGDSQEINNNPLPQKDIIRVITIYKNGFTVDDSPLRLLTDPANKEFLDDVSNGMVPRELEREARGKGNLKVDLVDKRGEEYVQPKKKS